MVVDVDKEALSAYREELVHNKPVVPFGKEYLQTLYESVADVKTYGFMYQ